MNSPGEIIKKQIKLVCLFIFFASLSAIILPYFSIKASSGPEINIFLPEAIDNPAALNNFSSQLGVRFTSAKWYLDWSDNFTPEIAQGFHSQGVIPELTWQPQINDTCISYKNIVSGGYDAYLNRFIASLKQTGIKTRITLAPEMNGAWAAWAVGNCNNSASDFVSFWKYTVDKFRRQSAPVEWIWSPNIHHYGETTTFEAIYPGDSYIDFLGLEGYNWGTSQSWSTWQSFSEVFGSSYASLVSLSGKNILITEMASAEAGGNKAQWISDMFLSLRTDFSHIQGITWFNINKETDWRINSSDASQKAFSAAANGNLSMPVLENNQPENIPEKTGSSDKNNPQITGSNSSENQEQILPSKEKSPEYFSFDSIKKEKYVLPLAKTTFFNEKITQKIPDKVKGAYISLADNNFQIDNLISPQNQVLIVAIIAFFSLVPLLIFI